MHKVKRGGTHWEGMEGGMGAGEGGGRGQGKGKGVQEGKTMMYAYCFSTQISGSWITAFYFYIKTVFIYFLCPFYACTGNHIEHCF